MVFNFLNVFESLLIVGCHIWNILLFMYSISFYFNIIESFNEYSFSIMLLNITIYVISMLNIFFIIFLFNTKIVKTLNNLKNAYNLQFVSISIVIVLLSLAGVPPVSGFLGKFLIFMQIFFKKNFILFLFFLFLNTFSIYFYIQNLRFLISKKISNIFIIKNYFVFFSNPLIFVVNIFNFFNFFSILYVEEFIVYFNLVSSYINF